MVLFDPSLLGLFGLVAYSSLNDSVQSFGLFGYVAYGLLCPIFLLGILGPFTFLGPITLSFILGAHGLSMNPLLSLLRSCCDPFSLFYITYCP